MNPAPQQPATADDLWLWIAACLDCGKPHTFRHDTCNADGCTWASPSLRTWASEVDGHTYRTRDGVNAWALERLRAEWDRR